MRCYDEFFIMNGNHFFAMFTNSYREEKKRFQKTNLEAKLLWMYCVDSHLLEYKKLCSMKSIEQHRKKYEKCEIRKRFSDSDKFDEKCL